MKNNNKKKKMIKYGEKKTSRKPMSSNFGHLNFKRMLNREVKQRQ